MPRAPLPAPLEEPRGTTLTARAEVVDAGRRQAVVRVDLTFRDDTGREKVCAVAQGTVLTV
ncbi:hypothetical protein [Streptomyces sp. NPDC057694]|uniref:hypothetical protein n=1 Tax=Streptomyces sp. NPDC057694 TaxID=3346216 RepID=UPI0036807BF2